jgi:hypothetical protein
VKRRRRRGSSCEIELLLSMRMMSVYREQVYWLMTVFRREGIQSTRMD